MSCLTLYHRVAALVFCQTLQEQDLDLVPLASPNALTRSGGVVGSLLGHGCPCSGAQGSWLIQVPFAGLLAPPSYATTARHLLHLRDVSGSGNRLSTSPAHEHCRRLRWSHLEPLLRQPAGRGWHRLPLGPRLGGGRSRSSGGRGRGEQQGMLGG